MLCLRRIFVFLVVVAVAYCDMAFVGFYLLIKSFDNRENQISIVLKQH